MRPTAYSVRSYKLLVCLYNLTQYRSERCTNDEPRWDDKLTGQTLSETREMEMMHLVILN